jgi:glycopeptide antibiotics resistance protein
VIKRFIVPVVCGIALLWFDNMVVRISLNWFEFVAFCSFAAILLTVLILFLNRSFKGCDVFVVIATGGLMAMYGAELLTHKNYWLSEDVFFNVAFTWGSVVAVCAAARFFDKRGRLSGFGVFFRAAGIVFFVFYAFLLAYALFFRSFHGGFVIRYRAVNLVPFATIIHYLHGSGYDFFDNIIGNVMLFAPAGFFAAVFRGRIRLWAGMAAIVAFSALCEILQYVFALGSSDIDDVILYAIGGFAGMLLCILLDSTYRAMHKGKGRLFVWRKAAE